MNPAGHSRDATTGVESTCSLSFWTFNTGACISPLKVHKKAISEKLVERRETLKGGRKLRICSYITLYMSETVQADAIKKVNIKSYLMVSFPVLYGKRRTEL